MIRSFDIFDTCLTRRVAEPAMVFDLVAEKLSLGKEFRFNRQESEREASRRYGEAKLSEIYEILGSWLDWDHEKCKLVMNAELAEETQQLIPVPQILKRLQECRSAGARVVFLSDMYLPSTFLRERLREHGFYQECDLLMVSCELRKSKHSGQLFEEAISVVGRQDWEHIGNNQSADVKAAIQAGLKGKFFPEGNLTSHELRLHAWTKEGAPIGAAWAGAARQARITLGQLTEDEHEIAAVAAGVAAPLLVAYVTWLCQRATHHGLDRLYFLARDGQILMDLFILISRAKGLTIEARYLHASRISLRFPRRFPMTDEDAARVFQANDSIPTSVVALRLGITEAELRRLLPTYCQASDYIPKRMLPACRDALATPNACDFLNDIATKRAKLLHDYLEQEGLMDGGNYGVVDLGWAGTLQAGIQKSLVENMSQTTIRGFYLGLNDLRTEGLDAEAFAFDYRQQSCKDVSWFVTLSELFCQANHGSTIGFQARSDRKVYPLLDEMDSDHPNISNWLELHQLAIKGFANAVILSNALPPSPSSLIRLLRSHMRWFYFLPTKAEAKAWGECRFSSHGVAKDKKPLAPPPRSLSDVLYSIGLRRFNTGRALWPQAVAARMPYLIAIFARYCQKFILRIRPLNW